jgi:hypothetical protein
MGDKSPKNNSKAKKQKANKKGREANRQAAQPTVVKPRTV